MRLFHRIATVLILTVATIPLPVVAATVTGSAPQRSVVWVSDGSTAPDAEAQIHNENRQFVPDTIIVRAGTSVRFPNDDPFFHSIYSSSPLDPFDIGYYGLGPGKVVNFPHAAIVEVRCHIHPQMHGTIVVTDGPGSSDLVTQFKIGNVLPGTHKLNYWNPRSGLRSETVIVPSSEDPVNIGALP